MPLNNIHIENSFCDSQRWKLTFNNEESQFSINPRKSHPERTVLAEGWSKIEFLIDRAGTKIDDWFLHR